MKAALTHFALWVITVSALAIDVSSDALKARLLQAEGPHETGLVARELEDLPPDQKKVALRTLVQLALDETLSASTRETRERRLIGTLRYLNGSSKVAHYWLKKEEHSWVVLLIITKWKSTEYK